jgi:hypothetical protein
LGLTVGVFAGGFQWDAPRADGSRGQLADAAQGGAPSAMTAGASAQPGVEGAPSPSQTEALTAQSPETTSHGRRPPFVTVAKTLRVRRSLCQSHCAFHQALVADRQLREAYGRAVRNDVDPAKLAAYRERWWRLRVDEGDRPSRLAADYADLARRLHGLGHRRPTYRSRRRAASSDAPWQW